MLQLINPQEIVPIFVSTKETIMQKNKDLNFYKENCEEDYIKTPISVLRYIIELEKAVEENKLKNEIPKKEFNLTKEFNEMCDRMFGGKKS